MKGIILLIPIGGLCNRMQFINSVYKAWGSTKKIIVVWTRKKDLCIRSNDFFEFPEDITVIDIDMYSLWQNCMWTVTRKILSFLPFYMNQMDYLYGKQKGNKDNFFHMFEKKLVLCEGCEEIIPCEKCDIFKIKNEYISKALNITSDKEYVAFHIRRTDNEICIRSSTDKEFIERIEKEIAKGNRIFLATDDLLLKNRIIDQYEDRVFGQNFVQCDRDNERGMETAFIDLLCLANSTKIYVHTVRVFHQWHQKYMVQN